MGLETTDNIEGLNANWPLGTDPKSQGDDHLRLLKAVLQADAASLTGQPLAAFTEFPTVPDGATGKQVPNADDIPGLAGTGPVTIVDSGTSYIIIGDVMIVFARLTTNANGWVNAQFPKEFASEPSVQASYRGGALVPASEGRTAWVAETLTTSVTVEMRLFSASQVVAGTASIDVIAIGNCLPADAQPLTVQTAGGTELQEFHDPTGAQSWRIVGTTLEIWGQLLTDAGGLLQVDYGKQFAQPPAVTTNALATATASVTCNTDFNLATGFQAHTTNNANGIQSAGAFAYHSIGQWDGIS